MSGTRTTAVGAGVVVVACVLVLAPCAGAQQASGIAGIVRDTTGAVLPGVTVEGASPVLIEKARSVVTDGQGQYKILDLRPGMYVVTFSLGGFNTIKREGIQLSAGFTAPVDAEMRVSAIEETVTVTGASPLVDVQNVRQQQVVSSELLDTLPTSSKNLSTLQNMIVGLSNGSALSAANVGGAKGEFKMSSQTGDLFHGKLGGKTMFDGIRTQATNNQGTLGYITNPFTVEEMTVETGGGSAESAATGVAINMIPKDGGNLFKVAISALYTNSDLQNDNLSDELRSRGLTTVSNVRNLYDVAASVGGPIKKNRVWFFATHRNSGSSNQQPGLFYNKTQGTLFYTPDLSRPAYTDEHLRSDALRLTWQASQRNKISIFADNQNNCVCKNFSDNTAVEALGSLRWHPQGLYLVTWNAPVTSRLLFEAGAAAVIARYTGVRQPEVTPNDLSILDLRTGFRYNAGTFGGYGGTKVNDRYVQRFSTSYITGSHAFKVGFQLDEGVYENPVEGRDIGYQFLGTVPTAVDQFASPLETHNRLKADLGVYAQDRWTVRRLTLNLGLRFDYFNSYVPAQSSPAGSYVPARDFGPVYDVPNWTDLNPRLGVSYDLFGTGRTALKMSFGRYLGVGGLLAVQIADANNPMVTSVNNTSRTWNDANGNYVPDCDLRNPLANGECGAFANQNFGRLNPGATRWDDDVLHGYAKRDYIWDLATEVQHELRPGMSLTGGYYRNWARNFRVTDNLAVTTADFDSFCIAAPIDARLPGGGGYQVCGLADVAPLKFGQVQNLVTGAAPYGKQTQVSDFFNVSINARVASNFQVGGGVDTGRTVADRCFVVDSPQELLYCRVVTPFSAQTQVKFFGSYRLPWAFIVSGTFQNISGIPVAANYAATNAQISPSLGRNLAACRGAAACTATASVPLIPPQTVFEDRRAQLDLRLSKIISLGRGVRLQANLDVYNALNANTILAVNNTYGSAWRRPTAILDARLIEFGGQLTF